MSDKKKEWTEQVEVAGKDAVERIKELIEEGNVRRVIVRKPNGDPIADLPLTPSVVGGAALLVLTPFYASVAAVAAFLFKVKIDIVREEPLDESVYEDEKRKNDDDDSDKARRQRIEVE